MIVPLAIGAIPFFARLVETAVREVDRGLVEAVQAMGGSTRPIVRKVLLPEALPSLVSGVTTTVIALIGYSAMAGAVGGERARRPWPSATATSASRPSSCSITVVVADRSSSTVVQLHRRRSRTAPGRAAGRTAVLTAQTLRPASPHSLSGRHHRTTQKEALFVRKNIKITAAAAAAAALALGLTACGTSSDPAAKADPAPRPTSPRRSSSPRPRRRTPRS